MIKRENNVPLNDEQLKDYLASEIAKAKENIGNGRVLLGLSGGIDSSVCAALLSKAVPNQLVCIFVDHGFMRLKEGDEIETFFASQAGLQFIRVNAQERFLSRLKGVVEPEEKRKRIGEEFVRVFEEEANKLGRIPFLAQGTIYPDIVESGGEHGATIKSHHNVGGLPELLDFEGVVEPLAGLYKNEVRRIGAVLGLPANLLERQPFPGPGLAVRVIGEVTKDKLDILRQADAIFRQELDCCTPRPSQYFAVLTDTFSVGVKGGTRTYSPVLALRAISSIDFMTAECAPIPYELLGRIVSRITEEVPCISRVVYDITSKPPGTVEWE